MYQALNELLSKLAVYPIVLLISNATYDHNLHEGILLR